MCCTSEIVFLFLSHCFSNALLRSFQLWRTHSTAWSGLAHQMKHWLGTASAWGERQMQFCSLHHVISFICRRSLLIRDQTWSVKSQLHRAHSQMLLFPIQRTRNWNEITQGNAWQTHIGYQIRQSLWIVDHWTSCPTVSNARSWETLLWQAEQRLGSHKFVLLDLLTTCLRDAFLQNFTVTYEQAMGSLFIWQTWIKLISSLEKLLVRNGKPSQQDVFSLCTCKLHVCVHIVQYTQLYVWFLNFLLEVYVERTADCMWKLTKLDFHSWLCRQNIHSVPCDKFARYSWGSACQASRYQ